MPPSVTVLDRHEKLLRAFTAPDGMWRISSSVDDVSPRLRMAVLNYEDKYFRYHFGINPVSIARAAITNLRARRIVCGGSTITMQVARMMEPKPRTFRNKFVEMVRALDNESALDWIRENGNAGEVYFVEELGEGCLVRPGEPGADPVIYAATPKETGRT